MILPTFLLSLLLLGRRNVAGRSSKSECNRRLIAFSLPAQQRSSPEEVQGRAEKRRDTRTEFVSHWEVPNRMVALTDSDIQHVRKGPPKRRNIKKISRCNHQSCWSPLHKKSMATRDISMRRLPSRQLLAECCASLLGALQSNEQGKQQMKRCSGCQPKRDRAQPMKTETLSVGWHKFSECDEMRGVENLKSRLTTTRLALTQKCGQQRDLTRAQGETTSPRMQVELGGGQRSGPHPVTNEWRLKLVRSPLMRYKHAGKTLGSR